MVTCCTIIFLLWRYGAFDSPIEIQEPRHVPGVPQFVIDFGMPPPIQSRLELTSKAPLVWLDQQEAYFPSDISAQVANTIPYKNRTMLKSYPQPLTVTNLDLLNNYGANGTNIFLTSAIDVRESPAFFEGVVPSATTHKTDSAISCSIIITEKGNGTVDAFYMYFYAFNLGNVVLWHELGDHIGDWEHNMIRFKEGEPAEMWFSQHGNGQAFTYDALEKIGKRPVSYSARGSHANYAIQGTHDHLIPDLNTPYGFLLDYTSKGTLWDPTLSTYFYNYNVSSVEIGEAGEFESIGDSPVAAMKYRGKWGDEQYADDDPRQPEKFFGFSKYVGGPTGPVDKQLNRKLICPDNGIPCIVRKSLQV